MNITRKTELRKTNFLQRSVVKVKILSYVNIVSSSFIPKLSEKKVKSWVNPSSLIWPIIQTSNIPSQ